MARRLLHAAFMKRPTHLVAALLACSGCGSPGDAEYCELTPAIADAGDDRTVAVGSTVELDGSGSVAETLIIFDWTLTKAPPGSAAVLSGGHGARPTFTPDRAGAYELTLVIHAGGCLSPADLVTVVAEGR